MPAAADAGVVRALGWMLAGVAARAYRCILVFEHLLTPSPTRHHELAVARDPPRRRTRGCSGAARIAGGGAAAARRLRCRTGVAPAAVALAAALLALAGSVAWEYIWVEAGQSVPLS